MLLLLLLSDVSNSVKYNFTEMFGFRDKASTASQFYLLGMISPCGFVTDVRVIDLCFFFFV